MRAVLRGQEKELEEQGYMEKKACGCGGCLLLVGSSQRKLGKLVNWICHGYTREFSNVICLCRLERRVESHSNASKVGLRSWLSVVAET